MASLKSPAALLRRAIEGHYLNLSPVRIAPVLVLLAYGAAVGIVFNTGIDHPWDKLQHLLFFALLTLSIHNFFCCRLRISAATAFALGLLGEAVQALTPNHHASLDDAAANAVGIAVVVVAVALVRSERRFADRDQGSVEATPCSSSSEPLGASLSDK